VYCGVSSGTGKDDMTKHLIKAALAASGIAAGLAAGTAVADEAEVIELTQTACQFVEVETTDHGYTTTKKADCEAINAKTGDERLAQSQTLKLKPGKYVFRVTNKNVPGPLSSCAPHRSAAKQAR